MDSEALHSALDKIRGTDDEAPPGLTEEEIGALREYLGHLVSKGDRTESEELLCRHVRAVLQSQAVASRRAASGEPEFNRSNFALRAAIDCFLESRFENVKADQLALLQETRAKLAAMSQGGEPSPNELRLSALLDRCLDAYENWRGGKSAIESGPEAN